jgi:hypothetical protein
VAATFSTDICAPANDEASAAVAKAPAAKRENLGDFIYLSPYPAYSLFFPGEELNS